MHNQNYSGRLDPDEALPKPGRRAWVFVCTLGVLLVGVLTAAVLAVASQQETRDAAGRLTEVVLVKGEVDSKLAIGSLVLTGLVFASLVWSLGRRGWRLAVVCLLFLLTMPAALYLSRQIVPQPWSVSAQLLASEGGVYYLLDDGSRFALGVPLEERTLTIGLGVLAASSRSDSLEVPYILPPGPDEPPDVKLRRAPGGMILVLHHNGLHIAYDPRVAGVVPPGDVSPFVLIGPDTQIAPKLIESLLEAQQAGTEVIPAAKLIEAAEHPNEQVRQLAAALLQLRREYELTTQPVAD